MTFEEAPTISTKQEQFLPLIRSQVAKILLEHAGNRNNRLTQRDIATKLGTGWDVVHLTLKSLYRDGIIKVERNRIIVNKELAQKAAGLA
jgi:DNA-binding GntR family transcriptional regulator